MRLQTVLSNAYYAPKESMQASQRWRLAVTVLLECFRAAREQIGVGSAKRLQLKVPQFALMESVKVALLVLCQTAVIA